MAHGVHYTLLQETELKQNGKEGWEMEAGSSMVGRYSEDSTLMKFNGFLIDNNKQEV